MANESCGMHLCGTCAIATLIFGIVFILDGLGTITVNPWLLVGAYLAILGLYPMVMGKK